MVQLTVHLDKQTYIIAGVTGFALVGGAYVVYRFSKTQQEDTRRVARSLENLVDAVGDLSKQLESFQRSVKSLEGTFAARGTHAVEYTDARRYGPPRSVISSMMGDDDQFETADEAAASGEEVEEKETESVEENSLTAFFARIDMLHKDSDRPEESQEEIFTSLKLKNKEMPDTCHVLWRLARSYMFRSDVAKSQGEQEQQKELIYEGLSHAQQAVEVDDTVWQAHQWFAILLGSTNQYESTDQKIKDGAKYKEHVVRAIELNPEEPLLFHLLGRWCFAVSELTWIQRRAAAMLYGEPPSSTYDEALENFHQAEQLRPGFWKSNQLWIAKTYKQLYKNAECRKWLQSGKAIPVNTPEDRESHEEIKTLLSQV